MNTLAALFSSRTKAAIFEELFGFDAKEFYVRELERRTGFGVSTVRHELKNLAALGLVDSRCEGNRTYYRANVRSPLYPELRQLVCKTSGLVAVLKTQLNDPRIRAAFIFGSVARGGENSSSDIDLMVIGSVPLRELSRLLSGNKIDLGREINPRVFLPREFSERRKKRDHFVSNVMRGSKLFVVGNEDELGTMG